MRFLGRPIGTSLNKAVELFQTVKVSFTVTRPQPPTYTYLSTLREYSDEGSAIAAGSPADRMNMITTAVANRIAFSLIS